MYNSSSGLWACCWKSGNLDCSQPSDETFYLPSPEKFTVTSDPVVSHDTSATSSSASSLPKLSTPSISISRVSITVKAVAVSRTIPISRVASSTCTSDHTCSAKSGLSAGAKIDIGLSAAIGGLSLLAMILFLLRHIRRERATSRKLISSPIGHWPLVHIEGPEEPASHQEAEQYKIARSELEPQNNVIELD